jgi:dolichol-phosphate mannosyltransferase
VAAAELAEQSPSALVMRLAARPRVSVVIPARDEGERITEVLERLFAAVRRPVEVLVVVDSAGDSTVAPVRAYAEHAYAERAYAVAAAAGPAGPGLAGAGLAGAGLAGAGCGAEQPRLACLVNGYGAGPASAIRFGLDRATAPVIVVLMADGCDDVGQIDDLALLVEQGAVVASASRYAPGGSQRGAPLLKRTLSRLAGVSLRALADAGTCDATNSFKAYSAEFVRSAGVQSRRGFSVGIELTAKARRLRLPVAEIPTSWLERRSGRSGFRLVRWLPAYLRWYLYCFGPPPRSVSAGGALRD